MKEHRSFFWPLTLIAAGVIWLMINTQTIPSANLWALTHIWPYVLIALGVGLILRGLWRPFGMIVSALVVVGAMAAVIYAPQLGWDDAPQWGIEDSFAGAIPGSGKIESETRDVKDFHAVTIRYPGEIIIRQGDKPSVTVEAEDNLIPQLMTDVHDGTLVIENSEENYSKRVNPTENVKITITVKELDEINFSSAGTLQVEGMKTSEFELKLSGAGDATLKDLDVDSLTVVLSGAGKITLDGTADHVHVIISGLGEFNGAHLQSLIADIQISGAGTATLRVAEELTARVSGAGSVNYYGSPEVTENISGAGSVNKIGE